MPAALAIMAVASSLLLLGAAVVIGALRGVHRSRVAARAEASMGGETRPFVEGEDVVLYGTVRHLEDQTIAVKVSIFQDGSEAESSGSWTHSWIEIDREIEVAPFLLEVAGGQLVRIAPPKNVDVADTLDQKVWIDRNRRVLSAELVPGEKIYAKGRLERSDVAAPSSAYRDVQWGWGLVPVDGQMLLSSEPLGAGLRQRAAFHRGYAWIALGLLAALQLTLVWFYGRALGDTVTATVTTKSYSTTTDSDGDTHHHHVISFDSDEVALLGAQVEIDGDDYAWIDRGTTVEVRRANADNWNLGPTPTLHWIHGAVVFIASCAFWFVYMARRISSRPWFRRKVEETEPGRLPDPPIT